MVRNCAGRWRSAVGYLSSWEASRDCTLSLYRVQPVAAGCIIGWDAAMPLMQCPLTSTLVLILPTSEG